MTRDIPVVPQTANDYFKDHPFTIICGDALDVLSCIQTKIDCVITSPPYFQQREYGPDDAKELGREDTVDAYISNLIAVFKAIPLQPWGSVWVNIGDKRGHGNLLSLPEHFVIGMQNAGFALIDKVIWAKEAVDVDGSASGHCMIEPAPGRLNGNGWEPFYRFVVDPAQAWSDTCAVRIPRRNIDGTRYRPESLMRCNTSLEGRNLTNVWGVPVPRNGAGHFAAMPASLVERPIAMTCPEFVTERGPRQRLVTPTEYDDGRTSRQPIGQYTQATGSTAIEELHRRSGRQDTGREYVARYPRTTGWTHEQLPTRPGIVLDPFCGTGSTGEVAIKLGRRFIGIELYEEYAERSVAKHSDISNCAC